MAPAQPMLTDLPPELLDHITSYLTTAQSVKNLGSANRKLHAFVEKDAWQTFARTRFPSLYPPASSSHKDISRNLTTLSKAWDRRAFVARYIEPRGDIHAFPGNKKIDKWKRPRGQTCGFTPQLDCFEDIGDSWRERREVLACSAGAEICIRERRIGSKTGKDHDSPQWTTYKPLSALEGKDDVTSLHLLRPEDGSENKKLELITGTANGDLQLLAFPAEPAEDIMKTFFTTQGRPVRSSSLLQERFKPALLAANMGDTKVSLYNVDSSKSKIEPTTSIDIRPPTNGRRTYRAWSTNFLSYSHLAVGLGPSEEPIEIYTVTPSGLDNEPLRKFSLQNDLDKLEGEITLSGFAKKSTSSVYPIAPLPPSSTAGAGSEHGQVFLSGTYDGIVRLHDSRSDREVEQAYIDPTDDSAIYSLLPRGREILIVGTSRHSLLKVFDMRLGSKAYSYLDAASSSSTALVNSNSTVKTEMRPTSSDWNLFLKPTNATYPGRGGGNNWARRSAESSIYSLASPSPTSPYLYAGVENAVVEMAFTSVLDAHPDPVFFAGNSRSQNKTKDSVDGAGHFKINQALDLAMYNQTADMKLMTQRNLFDTWSLRARQLSGSAPMPNERLNPAGLDERWEVGS